MNSLIFISFLFCAISDGLLLDTLKKAPVTSSSFLTDTHFNMLMDLLHDERQSRVKLENYVNDLRQELTLTKQEVRMNNQIRKDCNGTIQQHLLEGINKTIYNKYESLKSNYVSLKMKYDNLHDHYTTLNNKSDQFERELTLLKHLKVVSDLQSVAKLQNKTQHLELELRKTNNKVSSLTNDGTSRKQDFIALLNKVQFIEQKTDTLAVRHNDTTAVLQEELYTMNHRGIFIKIVSSVNLSACSFFMFLRRAFFTMSNFIAII